MPAANMREPNYKNCHFAENNCQLPTLEKAYAVQLMINSFKNHIVVFGKLFGIIIALSH